MEILFALAILAGIGGIIAWQVDKKQKKKKKKHKALPNPDRRNLLTLQINDIVSYFGTDYVVRGKLIYSEDGFEWYDYMLKDGDETVWLSVEEDDELEAFLFRSVDDLKVTGKPPEFLSYMGDTYELEEYGRAQVTRHGQTGKKAAGSCRYFEYEAPGGRYLGVEQWGEGEFEVSVGEAIRPHAVEILPGDEVSAMSEL